jgi:hypothetical protein
MRPLLLPLPVLSCGNWKGGGGYSSGCARVWLYMHVGIACRELALPKKLHFYRCSHQPGETHGPPGLPFPLPKGNSLLRPPTSTWGAPRALVMPLAVISASTPLPKKPHCRHCSHQSRDTQPPPPRCQTELHCCRHSHQPEEHRSSPFHRQKKLHCCRCSSTGGIEALLQAERVATATATHINQGPAAVDCSTGFSCCQLHCAFVCLPPSSVTRHPRHHRSTWGLRSGEGRAVARQLCT